jgi:hypothetical protein
LSASTHHCSVLPARCGSREQSAAFSPLNTSPTGRPGLPIDQVCPSLMEVHQEWALPIGLPLSARQAYRLYRVCGTMKALLRTEGR